MLVSRSRPASVLAAAQQHQQQQHPPGWHQAVSRRARQPAAPPVPPSTEDSSSNARKSARGGRPLADAAVTAPIRSPPVARRTWRDFYRRAAEPQELQRTPPARQPLFRGVADAAPAATATTRALRAKISPALRTTNDWRRVQRKVLPKYLHVLDAVTAVQLLQCLARLQPPAVPAASSSRGGSDDEGVAAHSTAQSHGDDPEQHLLRLVSQLALSSTSGGASKAQPAGPGDAAARARGFAAARARGFASAASERQEFEGMLAVVFNALQHKLAAWPGSTLAALLSDCGRLGLVHEGFLQGLFVASTGQLLGQPMPQLAACLEAAARLGVMPPELWQQQWCQATQGRLDALSLPQLAALQLAAGQLQLQLPVGWWEQFRAAVLRRAGVQHVSSAAGAQQQPEAASATRMQQLTTRAADGVSSLLCTSIGRHHPDAWLLACLQLATAAALQRRLSASGAVLLLAACGLPGASRSLPGAAAARDAARVLLAQRMPQLPSPAGVELLLACLLQEPGGGSSEADTTVLALPLAFRAALEARLAEAMASLPTRLLLLLPGVLPGQPSSDDRLVSAWALVMQRRLPQMHASEVAECLVQGARFYALPSSWERAVEQRLQELE